MRDITSITGDAFGAAIVAKLSENELDEKTLLEEVGDSPKAVGTDSEDVESGVSVDTHDVKVTPTDDTIEPISNGGGANNC